MAYYGTEGDDIIDQSAQKIADWEQIYAKKGNDKVTFGNAIVIGGAGNDTLIGTTTLSTVAYWDSPAAVNVNLTTGIAQDGFGTTDQLINIHWVQGSGFNDSITGSAGDDFLHGGGGSDRFIGGGGKDQVNYYFQKSTDAKISYDAASDTFTIQKNFSNGDKGVDTLTGIDSISFSGTGSDNTTIYKKNFLAIGGFLRSVTSSKINYADNINPSQFKSGDFNGDGHQDYALVTQIGYGSDPSPTFIFHGDGKGNFADASSSQFAGSSLGVAGGGRTIISDFNRDGMSDIFQVNFGVDAPPYPGGLNRLYLSNKDTKKLVDISATISQVLAQHHAASAGDVNGDRYPDLVINSLSNGNLLYLNDGTGHLVARQDLLPNTPNKLVTNTSSGMVDVNNDGHLDLVLGRWEAQSSNPVSQVLINDGHGDFSHAQPIALPATSVPLEIILDAKGIDLNGDGLTDLMLSITHGGGSATEHDTAYYNTAYIQLLVNQGNGQFTDETTLRLPADLANQQKKGWYMSLSAVDFNHDGKTDILATAANGASTSIILMNQGNGTFKETWASEKGGLSIAIDANEDGMSDVLTLTSISGVATSFVEINTLTSGGIYDAHLDGTKLIGSAANDQMNGSIENDTFQGKSGNDQIAGGAGLDTAIFAGNRKDYQLSRSNEKILVNDTRSSGDGLDTLNLIERLQFADSSVNLTVSANASSIPAASLQMLEELYVAFFNRVPDADGLDYWITQFKSGMSINQIADSFYGAAILFSTLTQYSANMSNDDFVRVIYKNVLGRSGETAPPDADVYYWSSSLQNGSQTKGSLVSAMLTAAHTFKGDTQWGWVADLLDNKVKVANYFAVQLGLNYNTPEQSISQGMLIAAAVTPTGIDKAIELIGVQDASWAQV